MGKRVDDLFWVYSTCRCVSEWRFIVATRWMEMRLCSPWACYVTFGRGSDLCVRCIAGERGIVTILWFV